MGTVHKFRRPPKNRGRFSGKASKLPAPQRRRRRWRFNSNFLAIALLALAAAIAGSGYFGRWATGDTGHEFTCSQPKILDGDTFDCGGTRIRLAGIDAPELPGHCRPGRDCTLGDPYASTENLRRLIGSSEVQCRQSDTDHYGRAIARCAAGDVDLSCGQLDHDQAIRRYGWIWC